MTYLKNKYLITLIIWKMEQNYVSPTLTVISIEIDQIVLATSPLGPPTRSSYDDPLYDEKYLH